MSTDRRAWADEAVATRFSRMMCATTSPLAMASDPPLIGIVCAFTIPTAMLIRLYGPPTVNGWLLIALALWPIVVWALATVFVVRGARDRVVDWLAGLPFPVENVNGLLNGVAENLEVRFENEVPTREALNEVVEAVHPDCFALAFSEDEPAVPIRIGVLDSKVNPARSNYRRYRRVRALIDEALVALSERYPIAEVWIR